MKENILYISADTLKTAEVLRIITARGNWSAITAVTELEAIQKFLEHPISMVIFAYDINREMQQGLSEYYKKINPGIILLEPYGGGTGLLEQEIIHAFETAKKEQIT